VVDSSGLQVARGRRERLMAALFRGASLTLDNSRYLGAVRSLTDELLRSDLEPTDLTVEALGLADRPAEAWVIATEPGIIAGLEEAAWLFRRFGLVVERFKADGEGVRPNKAVLRIQGSSKGLLRLERVGLNLIRRMSGIATATRQSSSVWHSCAPPSHTASMSSSTEFLCSEGFLLMQPLREQRPFGFLVQSQSYNDFSARVRT
jgi:hypothetical protein